MTMWVLICLSIALSCVGPVAVGAVSSSSPIICEDSLDGGTSPPFNANDTPCLLGCGLPLAHASGSLLPGSVETSTIPYCQLNCVRTQASPEQSAAAPACYSSVCKVTNEGTPENIGWCMYWCVAGFSDIVQSTACVPSLAYGPTQVTVIGGQTETIRIFTHPAAWRSWYLTETILPHMAIATSTATTGNSAPSQATTVMTTSRATTGPARATSTALTSSASATSTATVSPIVSGSTAAVVEATSASASSSMATAKANAASGPCRVPVWAAMVLGAWVGWLQW